MTKIFSFRALLLACVLVCVPLAPQQAEAQSNKPAAKKPAAKKSAAKKPAAKKSSRKAAPAASTGSCKNVRIKTSKGYRTVRRCNQESSGPLQGGAVAPVDSSTAPELKARTIPDRAYAVDGHTFFHQGRKYRVVGINEEQVPAGNDLAKQRLQLALDSGVVAVEPDAVDDSGTVSAVVRVAGKNLADILNAR